jgi:hypothetical protein
VPEYSDDILKEIADLKRQVAALAAAAQKRTALTTASQGWVIPNRTTPSTPSSGAHLYAASGQLMVRQANGTSFPIEPAPEVPFTQGVAVDDVPVFNSPSNPDQNVAALHAAYQSLRDDCQSGLRQRLIQLKNSLEGGSIIAS